MMNRIMIAGPTCSGKSSLAVSLAQEIGGEIISVDSRQCYRQINVGTAKPSKDQLEAVPHYNISNLNLDAEDSAQKFYKRALAWSDEIEQKGNRVIYVGGSTLHLQSLVKPFDELPSSNQQNLDSLEREMKKKGIDALFEKLKEVDPEYAHKMDGKNYQRIFRALDVWMQTGKPFTSFHLNDSFTQPENISVFGLHWPRKMLHQRINKRCNEMIENGLIQETEQILDEGFSQNLQALQTVGYKQVIQYLNKEIDHDQMIKDFKTATRRYAKRQITWFRRWPFLEWLDRSTHTEPELIERIKQQVAADSQKG
ncbi:MAG: tRNA (adenosine(37)-N6)-dimethylallyltransferase MiaA [Balneolaceae bacterium]